MFLNFAFFLSYYSILYSSMISNKLHEIEFIYWTKKKFWNKVFKICKYFSKILFRNEWDNLIFDLFILNSII